MGNPGNNLEILGMPSNSWFLVDPRSSVVPRTSPWGHGRGSIAGSARGACKGAAPRCPQDYYELLSFYQDFYEDSSQDFAIIYEDFDFDLDLILI